MKKKLLPLAMAAAVASISGCTFLTDYCGQDKLRESIRKLNPYDFVDAAAVAGCAGLEAFIVEDEKLYSDKPLVVFVGSVPSLGIEKGAKARLLNVDYDGEKLEVRLFGKTMYVEGQDVNSVEPASDEDKQAIQERWPKPLRDGSDGDGGAGDGASGDAGNTGGDAGGAVDGSAVE